MRDYKTLVALGALLSGLLTGTEYDRAINVESIASRAVTQSNSEDLPQIPRSVAGGTTLEMEPSSMIQPNDDNGRPKSIANTPKEN